MASYDAILVMSFGGPNGPDDVIPFLENVLRGRGVPHERLLEVAEHYKHFGGASPINEQNEELIAALKIALKSRGHTLPVYWGNRNWHPFLEDTLHQMAKDGVTRVLAYVTSATSSYSSCRQYLEDFENARTSVAHAMLEAGKHEEGVVPVIDKLRLFYNHPGFIDAMVSRVQDALDDIPDERHAQTELIFTAHSIPISMANTCAYVAQLEESSRLVTEGITKILGMELSHRLVYQSRSGPLTQPWLEPDIGDYLKSVKAENHATDVVIVPIGFVSDHMEVLFDLDTEAKEICDEIGLNMVRAGTVGTHPRFVEMICELIEERLTSSAECPALGCLGASPHTCDPDCCPKPQRPKRPMART